MTDWAVYGYDLGSSGKNAAETILTTSNFMNLVLASGWPTTLDGKVQAQILVVGAYAYVTTRGGSVYKLDAITGAIVGRYNIGGSHVGSSTTPHIVGGIGYVGADDGYLYAFNTATMTQVWRSAVQDPTAITTDVCVVGTRVYYGSLGGTIHAALISTGAQDWALTGYTACAGPVSADATRVYFAVGLGVIGVLLTGGVGVGAVKIWRSRNAAAGPAIMTDAAGQTLLCFSTNDHWSYAYDLATNSRVWMDHQAGKLQSPMGLDFYAGQGYAVIGTNNWSIQPHRYLGGMMQWKRDGTAGSATVAGFAIANGVLFGVWAPNDGRLAAWQLDDTIGGHVPPWKFGTATGIGGSDSPGNQGNLCCPTPVNGRLYWGADDNNAYCFALP